MARSKHTRKGYTDELRRRLGSLLPSIIDRVLHGERVSVAFQREVRPDGSIAIQVIPEAKLFGPSPMAAAVPEMQRLRAAEDAHNKKWHPGMTREGDDAN